MLQRMRLLRRETNVTRYEGMEAEENNERVYTHMRRKRKRGLREERKKTWTYIYIDIVGNIDIEKNLDKRIRPDVLTS